MVLQPSVLAHTLNVLSKTSFIESLFFLECVKLLGEKWCLLVVVQLFVCLFVPFKAFLLLLLHLLIRTKILGLGHHTQLMATCLCIQVSDQRKISLELPLVFQVTNLSPNQSPLSGLGALSLAHSTRIHSQTGDTALVPGRSLSEAE